jgi:2-polyprenyl-6-methoxyphenol hydroxylase-like FAD-dependent oxidoreductase
VQAQNPERELFDVAIIGSGFAGSMLGAILARNGAKVLLLDSKAHPKFAIGESTIPNMLVTLRTMALRYQVPELMALSTFTGCQKVISAAHGQKVHFGFIGHQEGAPQDPRQLTMFNFPRLMLHPAAHMLRQDTDAYLYNVAIKYGCTTHTAFHTADVELRTRRPDPGPLRGRRERLPLGACGQVGASGRPVPHEAPLSDHLEPHAEHAQDRRRVPAQQG